MIAFLEGTIVSKSPAAVTISVRDVGYEVLIPLSTYEALPAPGQTVRLLTHLHAREDNLCLFGFAREAERELFRLLLGVNGIGPRLALKILSSCPAEDFKRFIAAKDVDSLCTVVKGVGKKIAQRLILELHPAVVETAAGPSEVIANRSARDAVQVLVSLGERRVQAEKAIGKALRKVGPQATVEALVKEALTP